MLPVMKFVPLVEAGFNIFRVELPQPALRLQQNTGLLRIQPPGS